MGRKALQRAAAGLDFLRGQISGLEPAKQYQRVANRIFSDLQFRGSVRPATATEEFRLAAFARSDDPTAAEFVHSFASAPFLGEACLRAAGKAEAGSGCQLLTRRKVARATDDMNLLDVYGFRGRDPRRVYYLSPWEFVKWWQLENLVPLPTGTRMPQFEPSLEGRRRLLNLYLRPWVQHAHWACAVVPHISDLDVVIGVVAGQKRKRLQRKTTQNQGEHSHVQSWQDYARHHVVSQHAAMRLAPFVASYVRWTTKTICGPPKRMRRRSQPTRARMWTRAGYPSRPWRTCSTPKRPRPARATLPEAGRQLKLRKPRGNMRTPSQKNGRGTRRGTSSCDRLRQLGRNRKRLKNPGPSRRASLVCATRS